MVSELVIGGLPIFGVVVGAMLQYFFARSNARQDRFAGLRNESYADYLKAVANAAINRTPSAITEVTDAKCRMAIYGSNSVIEKLARFETTGAKLSNEQGILAFVAMAEQMRTESGNGTGGLPKGVLYNVMFGPRPAEMRPTPP